MKMPSSLPFGAALVSVLFAITPVSAQQLVPLGPFDSVELEGGGHVTVRHGDVQAVRLLKGSTALTRFRVDGSGKLRIEACNNDCPHHYDLEVEITTPHIRGVAISGGGTINSDGNFPERRLGLAVEGGGAIDTRSMEVEKAEAAVEGGGVIRLRASGELTAAVNGGGEIRYWGEPHVTQAVNGGGEIQHGD